MQIPDLVNGLFEFAGGCMLSLNVRKLYADKLVKGVHWLPTLFFASWGVWNLYFYPNLGQWLSFAGGLWIVTVNVVWFALMMLYWKRSQI